MFGAEEYSNQELMELIADRLPDCSRYKLEIIAAIVCMQLPSEKNLAKIYKFKPKAET